MKLRIYQQEAFDNYKENKTKPEIAFVIPQRGGKSVIISKITNMILKEGRKVIIMTTFGELIDQLKDHLDVEPRILRGTRSNNVESNVILGLEQTIHKRLDKLKDFEGCVILKDEGQGYDQKRTTEIIDSISPIQVCHFNGTPYDAKGLALYPKAHIIKPITMEKMVEDKFICETKHFVPHFTSKLKFDEVKMTGGDYTSEQLEGLLDEEWFKKDFKEWFDSIKPENRHTIIITASIKMAEFIAEILEYKQYSNEQGSLFSQNKQSDDLVLQSVIHSKKSDSHNDSSIKAFNEGKIKILISVSKLAIGFNSPIADTLVNLRATKIRRLFNQLVFRASTLSEGKNFAEHYDIGNCLIEHGFPEFDYEPPSDVKDLKALNRRLGIKQVNGMIGDGVYEISKKNIALFDKEIGKLKQKDLVKCSIKELKKLFNNSNNVYELISIALIVSDKLTAHSYNKNSYGWTTKPYADMEGKVLEWDVVTASVKKRLNTLLKERKKITSIHYYLDWLIKDSWIKFTIIEDTEKIDF